MNRILILCTITLLLAMVSSPARALDLSQMFKSKPALTEDERKETVERIREVQEKLQLLQDKLRVLEKRKAMETAAEQTGADQQIAPGATNWLEVDKLHIDPGAFGIYTYLLFAGSEEDITNLGRLEDLILTIETLPPSSEPATITSRFLLPVEPQQSTVVLARRPYDFKLSRSYLERLGLKDLPDGPVLVSLAEPLDPFGMEMTPPFLAVALGHLATQKTPSLLKTWHGYEKPSMTPTGHPMADLFWQLLDGAGPTRVIRTGGTLLIDLAPPTVAAAQQKPLNR